MDKDKIDPITRLEIQCTDIQTDLKRVVQEEVDIYLKKRKHELLKSLTFELDPHAAYSFKLEVILMADSTIVNLTKMGDFHSENRNETASLTIIPKAYPKKKGRQKT